MNTLRSFYSNVLYSKSGEHNNGSNHLTVPSTVDGIQLSGKEEKKRRKSSSRSLSNISDNFIRAVENMESVVLIPTKLLDIPVAGDMTIPDLISSGHSNLYDIYKSIRGFKDKLTTLNVTDEDEEDTNDDLVLVGCGAAGGGAIGGTSTSSSGPSSATFDVDDIIANLTASLNEQGFINNNNNSLDNNNQVKELIAAAVVNNNNNNNTFMASSGQVVPTIVTTSNVPSVTVTNAQLKSVPSTSSMADTNGSNKITGDSNNNGGHEYCDSGVWSSEGGGSSRDSIDDVSEECISFADPSGTNSPTGRLSVEPNETTRTRKSGAVGGRTFGLQGVQYHNHHQRQQIMSAASRYVVKKSLSSAKGFCSFLIDLTQVTESVITKYMEEIECMDQQK